MACQVVEHVGILKNRCVTFCESGSTWPMIYGPSCMVRCQKRAQALGGQVENEIGSVILPTLAGQVGLGV